MMIMNRVCLIPNFKKHFKSLKEDQSNIIYSVPNIHYSDHLNLYLVTFTFFLNEYD